MADTCELCSEDSVEAHYNGKELCETCVTDELWVELLREALTSDDYELRSMALTVLEDSHIFDTLHMNVYEHALKWLIHMSQRRVYEFTKEDLATNWDPSWSTQPGQVLDVLTEQEFVQKNGDEYTVGEGIKEVGRAVRRNEVEDNRAARALTGKLILELAHERGGSWKDGGVGNRKFLKAFLRAIDENCLDDENNLEDNTVSMAKLNGAVGMTPMKFMSRLSSMIGLDDGNRKVIEKMVLPPDEDKWSGNVHFKMDWIKTRQRARTRFNNLRERGDI